MKSKIIVAGIIAPIFFVVLFFMPTFMFTAVIAVICAVAAYELQRSIGVKGNDRIVIYITISAILIPIGVYFGNEHVFRAVFLALMSIMFIEAILTFKTIRQIKFAQILTVLFGGIVMPYFLSSLISLVLMPQGRFIVLLPVICAFVTDGGAFLTGSFFGKNKAFPAVSPKKTIEGCIGGISCGMAAVLVYGVIIVTATLYDVSFWALVLYGFVGAVFTELGDLAFSLIKREYDFKDYGTILPGHGGILDRFDSMIFTAPAIHLMVTVMPAIIVELESYA